MEKHKKEQLAKKRTRSRNCGQLSIFLCLQTKKLNCHNFADVWKILRLIYQHSRCMHQMNSNQFVFWLYHISFLQLSGCLGSYANYLTICRHSTAASDNVTSHQIPVHFLLLYNVVLFLLVIHII